MQRTLSTFVLLALLASGLFLGAHTALAAEREAGILTYEVGTAIEPGRLPEVTGGTPAVYLQPRARSACGLDI